MYTFGAGVLIGTPQTLADGTAIATPTPVQFCVLQDVTIDQQWESKTLYGANSFPVAVGRGKGKIDIKASSANFNAELFNAFIYGQTTTAGYGAIYQDLTGTPIPTSPFQITPTPPNSGVFAADLGAQDANAVPFTKVAPASTPTGGQYNVSGGVYTFSTQDNAAAVRAYINYRYTNASSPASAKTLNVLNQPMGYAPFFQADFSGFYRGKAYTVRYPQVMASKLSLAWKNDDFTIPNFEMEAFADSSGYIAYMYFYD